MDEPLVDSVIAIVGGRRFRRMIDGAELNSGIQRVAEQLSERYAGTKPLVIGVLNGAALFHADLIRRMPIALHVDYVRAASYHGSMSSSGEVNFDIGPGTQMAGRNVILVEDIVDTGRTVEWLRHFCAEAGAASVEVATLLYKRHAHHIGASPDYVAFEIPDRFVVGFGLDYQQEGRNLPAIYAIDDPPSGT